MKKINPLKKYRLLSIIALFVLLTSFVNKAHSQVEVEPWGDINGIREHGQLFELRSTLKMRTGDNYVSTNREKQHQHYKRVGDEQVITTNIDSLYLNETVKDESDGKIKVTFTLNAHAEMRFDALYFCLELPNKDYDGGRTRFPGTGGLFGITTPAGVNFDGSARGSIFKSPTAKLKVKFDGREPIMIRRDVAPNAKNDIQLYAAIKLNGLSEGEVLKKTFIISVGGNIDEKPVDLTINTAQTGRQFDGLGGNFRLQNPKTDRQVIDYCLQNLRVAYGRVELPWRFWQPDKNVNPIATADSGKLHYEVKKAIAMTRRLDSMGMPLVLTAWFPPAWAAEGKLNNGFVNGIWGNPLNKANMNAIYKSIADYIIYLKKKYGVEVKLFSFNESDLGVNVRVTPQQHDDFIKGCGAYFAAHGIRTKMLLGDNSNASTYQFIYPALNDPAAKPYIGAVAFHSWSGWETETLQHWADAATKLNVPLLVTEGSIDASAYNYPDIFDEPIYALKEINLYTRLLAICQPSSILQWQLTADYSPLIGGGIFGNNQPLHPGQRFWNLKQLSITPKGLFAMPITCDAANISCAALGDNQKGSYAIQLVNNGAERKAILWGLPANITQLRIYTTSTELNMKEGSPVTVKNGKAKFNLPADAYISLISQ